MNSISVSINKKIDYTITIQHNIMDEINKIMKGKYTSAALITDQNVYNHYGKAIEKVLSESGLSVKVIVIAPGDKSKSLYTTQKIYKELLSAKIQRRSVLIALGGGVIIDTVGYIAATYMRGIPYVNIATSLIAQSDTAIGGKVAVNHPAGKNLIGAFYFPDHVFIDPQFLLSLSPRDMRSGMAEIIKTAVISDVRLFEELEKTAVKAITKKDMSILTRILKETVQLKLKLLEPDPFEVDLRRILNFGHTVGHAIEKVESYRGIRHGEAVAVGMAVASQISINRGIAKEAGERIINLIRKCGLPITTKVAIEEVINAMQIIKMIRNSKLNYVIPTNTIGEMLIINDLEEKEIAAAFYSINKI